MAHTGNNTLSNILLILGGDDLSNETVKELLIPILETWRGTPQVHETQNTKWRRLVWLNLKAGDVSWMIKIEAGQNGALHYIDIALEASSDWEAKQISHEIAFDCHDSFFQIFEALGA